ALPHGGRFGFQSLLRGVRGFSTPTTSRFVPVLLNYVRLFQLFESFAGHVIRELGPLLQGRDVEPLAGFAQDRQQRLPLLGLVRRRTGSPRSRLLFLQIGRRRGLQSLTDFLRGNLLSEIDERRGRLRHRPVKGESFLRGE